MGKMKREMLKFELARHKLMSEHCPVQLMKVPLPTITGKEGFVSTSNWRNNAIRGCIMLCVLSESTSTVTGWPPIWPVMRKDRGEVVPCKAAGESAKK